MPRWYDAQLRHAKHYSRVASRIEKRYLRGGEAVRDALAQFDQERAQIDAGWGWVRAQASLPDADTLLLDYADATTYVGDLRYNKRRERIPQLEAALAAAQRRQGVQHTALYSIGHSDTSPHETKLVLSRSPHAGCT
jgi:hypothetical protein